MPRGIPKAGQRAKGAGHPRWYPPEYVRVTVTLDPQDAADLRALGNGNASAGVRRLLMHEDARRVMGQPRRGASEAE